MITISSRLGLRLIRRLLSSVLDAALAASPFALPYVLGRPVGWGPWIQIGLPFAIFVPIRFLVLTLHSSPTEVTWDRTGLRVTVAGETISVSWPEYAGHRLTWVFTRRLKVYRSSEKKPIVIDWGAFDAEQRELLVSELTARTSALPNKRLKLTARVD